MSSKLKAICKTLFDVEPNERLKVLLLTIAFFCIVGAYTITKELKDSIFAAVVGREYIPQAKFLAMIFLIPAILFYSKLVDKMRRYKLLSFYSLVYALLSLVFALMLGHPSIGISNTDTSPHRLFGWIFYFFVEGYSPFVVSVFWAFANSINNPASAKNNYGLIVSGSKLGGIVSAGLAWGLLSLNSTFGLGISDTASHQILLVFSAILLFLVPIILITMMNRVSGKHLHGYEAAYQVEKQRGKTGKAETGIFSGLRMFITYPYILGIFCMVFFYELIYQVLSYQRVSVAQANSATISDVSGFLLKLALISHVVGLIISLFGTRSLLKKLGERRCLVLVPCVIGLLLFYFMISYTQYSIILVFIALRAINYGFSYPVRESLYIPTVKEIKFKSKSWIDAFGTKFAKTSGSSFNWFAELLGPALFFPAHSIFFASTIIIWLVAAALLGRRFEQAIVKNEVIGIDDFKEE